MTISFSFNPVPEIDDAKLGKDAAESASKHTPINENAMPVTLVELGQRLKRYYSEELERAQQSLHDLQNRADTAENATSPTYVENKLKTGAASFYGFDFSGRERRIRQNDEIFRQRNKALGTFMRFRGLTTLPTRADQLLNPKSLILIMLGVLVAEAILNAFMFWGTIPLVTAVTITLGQALVNIGLSYTVGWLLWPRLVSSYSSTLTRVTSCAVFLVHVAFSIYINFAISFYRARYKVLLTEEGEDLSDQRQMEVVAEAAQVWTHPDFWEVTVITFGTAGLVFALFSYIKGYFSDDPNPGFGPMYRGIKRSNSVIEDELEECVEDWEAAKQSYRTELGSCISDAKAEISAWSEAINLIEKVKIDWMNIFSGLNRLYQQKVNLYVDSYNEVSADKAIPPSVELLREGEVDVENVFADVKHYFLSDAERLQKVEEMEPVLDELYEKVGAEFEELSVSGNERISRVSASFPSSSIGGD